jgi:hypothetical protein
MSLETCELKNRGAWQPLSLEQALFLDKDRPKRCPECHGKVRAHGIGKNGEAAHFEHDEKNPGCSLIPQHFDGTKRMHRKPMV